MAIKRNEKRFILYSHANSFTNETFYVGIGKPGREKQSYKRSKVWSSYVKKYGFYPTVLIENLSWDEACDYEKNLIVKFGRKDKGKGALLNMTDGGDGAIGQVGYWKGRKRPELSERNRGNKYGLGKDGSRGMTPEVIERIKKGRLGKPPWNKGQPGRKWTEEEKEIFSKWRKGKKHSIDTKSKISNAHKGKKRSDEHVKNMSLCRKGVGLAVETKVKLSKIHTERWKRIKATAGV